MPHDISLDQLVDRAARHWERRAEAARSHPSPRPPRPFTVAIAREAGSGASEIAQEVGLRLGWTVYDRELLEQIAREMGLRANLLETVDERHGSWWSEGVEQFLSTGAPIQTVTVSAFVRHLAETVLALGAHGECVIVGRGSAQILPRETTLRVRLVAPFKDRVARVQSWSGLDEAEAARRVQELDRERHRFVRDHFIHNVDDPCHFDLILNTSRLSASACAELIVVALKEVSGDRQRPAGGQAPGEVGGQSGRSGPA
jgi:cytidylate kinase